MDTRTKTLYVEVVRATVINHDFSPRYQELNRSYLSQCHSRMPTSRSSPCQADETGPIGAVCKEYSGGSSRMANVDQYDAFDASKTLNGQQGLTTLLAKKLGCLCTYCTC